MADKKRGVPTVSVGTNSGATVSLCVLDRLIIGTLFPREGSIEQQEHAQAIIERVLLEQDEATDVALTTREGRMSYNKMKDFDREFKFSYREINFLKDQVQRMDNEKKVTSDMLGLCRRIREAKVGK